MNSKNSTFFKELIFISTFLTTLFVSAQSKPGGTSLDVELWLKADQIPLENFSNVTIWQDQSGNSRDFKQNITNSSPVPIFTTSEGMNYNPSLNFSTIAGNSVRKLVGPASFINSTKEYYIFYVSKLNSSSGYSTVLEFQTGVDNPSVGWVNAIPWFNDGSNRSISYPKTYAINSVFYPNSANNNSTKNIFYINNSSTIFNGSTITTGTGGLMIIGAGSITNRNAFIGNISEIIVLSKAKGSGEPQVNELEKINSYLSLKYGISKEPISTTKYINSSSTTIWDSNNNTAYNNYVFGIIRDDATGLYQKQATNYSNNDIVLSLGNLQPTNKDNTETIANNSYLLLGSNNLNSTVFYKHTEGTSFKGGVILDKDIFKRTNRVYKASSSNITVNVNLNNNLVSSQYVLVSEDVNFSPSNTKIFPVTNGVAENVVIANNEFISFVSNEKAPGGSELNVELWLKADYIFESSFLDNNSNLLAWNDASSYRRRFSQNSSDAVPKFNYNGMNFNPTLFFGTDTYTKLVGPENITDPTKEYYIYYVSETTSKSDNAQTILAFNQELNNSYGWRYATTTNNAWTYVNSTNIEGNGIGKKFGINSIFAPNIANSTSSSARTVIYMNSVKKEINTTQAFSVSNTNRMSIGTDNLSSGWPFYGNISEIIVLSKNKSSNGLPSDFEVNKINSYLGLKYGITLDKTAQPNYYNSNGNIIWNGDDIGSTDFKNDIFGIGRDDLNGLYQKQSTNYEDNTVTMYLGSLKKLNIENTGTITTDLSYLVLGSNDSIGTKQYSQSNGTSYAGGTATSLPYRVTQRFSRTLRAKKTGNIPTVNLKLANEIENAPYIIVSQGRNFKPSETRLYSVQNGVAQNVVINDGDYIGFISINNTPGGSFLNPELWLKADDLDLIDNSEVLEWKDKSVYKRDFKANINDSVPLFYFDGMNYNPRLYFNSNDRAKLVGPENMIDPEKEYYFYYVSKLENNGYNTVFAVDGNGSTNGRFGWNSNHPWFYDTTNRNYTPYSGKLYGINAVYSPNKTTSISTMYSGGKPFDFASGDTTLPTSSTNKMVIGSGNSAALSTYTPFIGDLSELIVLSTFKGTNGPNLIDVHKVNSYLAIKYGLTLDPSSQPDYYDSDYDIVWKGSDNIGYQKNVFGIGRDEIADLYQKQSSSIEAPAITVYLNELVYTNKANTGTIENESFLMFGSNGLEGERPYEYAANTTFKNGALPNNINRRYNTILKVDKTGSINTFNMAFENELYNVEYVLISTENTFSPTTTYIHPVINGKAIGLTANDGDYISFASYRSTFSENGFTTELWLDANELTIDSDSTAIAWYDKSNNNRNFFKYSTNNVPSISTGGMNFNPTLKFNTTTNSKLVGPNNLINSNKEYYIYYVSESSNSDIGTVFSFNQTANNSYGWTNNSPWFNPGTARTATNGIGKNFAINTAYLPNAANSATIKNNLYVNGVLNSFDGSTLTTSPTNLMIVGTNNLTDGNSFNGSISEIIILSKDKGSTPDLAKINKVNSYLALKYGITLNQTPPEGTPTLPGFLPNYYNSAGDIIWDRATNSGYQKNIFGIGRDDLHGLNQKQATSYDYNSITAYLGDLKYLNNENTSTIGNNEFIIFGSNGLANAESYVQPEGQEYRNRNTLSKAVQQKYRQVLKVQKSSTITSINLKLSNDLSDVPYVIVSNNTDFTPSNTDLYPVVNGIVENLSIADGSYISFLYFRKSPGGSDYTTELWLKSDALTLNNNANVITWYDQSINYRNFTQYNTSSVPVFNYDGMNFNPTLKFNTTTNSKLVGPQNIIDPTKEYYIYYVSKLDESSTGYNTVFALDATASGTHYPGRIGWNSSSPWFYDTTNRNYTPFTGRTYGINTIFSPNNATSIASIYSNGTPFHFASGNTTLPQSNTNLMVVGNGNYNGNYTPFIGDISEIIILSKDKSTDGQPINTDIQKVNSYLALKYGITLDKIAQSNYYNSAGNIIWNGDENQTYQDYIFGIGRDDLTGFNQKQSTSYDNPLITAYIGDLKDLNNQNTATFDRDKSFLLFGIKNRDEFTDYDYNQGAQFEYTTSDNDVKTTSLTTRVNYRYNIVTKVRNINNVGIINLSTRIGADYLLISKDPSFPQNNTQVHPIIDNNIKNIILEDGDYIGFAAFITAPGGVINSLKLWLSANADNIIFDGTNNVSVWKDLSPLRNNYSYDVVRLNGKTYPIYDECNSEMNFNPTVKFGNTAYLGIYGDLKNPAPMSTNSPDNYTSFTVYRAQSYADNARLYTHGFGGIVPNSSVTRYPAMGFAPLKGVGRLRNDGSGQTNVDGNLAGFVQGTTALQMIHTKRATANNNGYATHDFGGWEDNVAATGLFGQGFRMAQGGIIGGASLTNATFNGLISEVFFYERELNSNEKDKIRSYIGIKYAITIDENPENDEINYNYTLSNGVSVWNGNAAPNIKYHHNVAGLVRDDAANLSVSLAKPTSVGGIITMVSEGSEICSTTNPSLENDFSGLFWGDNNEDILPENLVRFTGNEEICGALDSRLNRVWLVDKTNLAKQAVTMKASGTTFPYNGSGYELFLLVADSPEKITNNQWDQMIPMTYLDGEHQVNFEFVNKYTYFSIGAKDSNACEGCKFTGEKTFKFTRALWPNGNRVPKDYNLGDDFNVQIAIENPYDQLRRGYPRYYSRNTLRENRIGSDPITTSIKFSTDTGEATSAKTSFEIYDIDRTGYQSDKVNVLGYCNGNIVYPTLNYTYNRPARSRYAINSNVNADAKQRGVADNGNSGYTNNRGKVFVEFDVPVDEIKITYTTNNSSNNPNRTTYIGIGPMTFTCPSSIPPRPNEDGLIFTKYASPSSLELCEFVDFTYELTNTNCESKTFDFTDTLPEGMIWVKNSLIVTNTDLENIDVSFPEVSNDRQIKIKDLVAPGGGYTYKIRLQAAFKEDAISGLYTSEPASINYIRYADGNNININLESYNYYTGEPEVEITALPTLNRPKPLTSTIRANSSTFKENSIIELTVEVKNPNEFNLDDIYFAFDYDYEALNFQSIDVYYRADENGTNTPYTVPQRDPDIDNIEIENITLKPGITTFVLKYKVPDDLDLLIAENGTLVPIDINFSYEFFSESEDVCTANTTYNANGEIDIEYKQTCTKPSVGGLVQSSNAGISTLKNQFKNWPIDIPNGFLVLESGKKGMVLTRVNPETITDAVKGMIIYNTEEKCISIYNGISWKCIERACND